MSSSDLHPLDIPDSLTAYRIKDDSQERGGEESWNPEERENVDTPIAHARNTQSQKGNTFSGGGIGAMDALETLEQHGASDPEMRQLKAEYDFAVEKGEERKFDDWLKGEDREGMVKDIAFGGGSKNRGGKERSLNQENLYKLSAKPDFWEKAPKDVREFYLAWTQKGDRRISSMTIYNGRNGIDGIGIRYNLGYEPKQASFGIDELLKWFKGVEGYHEYGSKNYPVVGLELKSSTGKSTVIHPETDPHKIYKTVGKIRLENIRLPEEVGFNFEGAGFYNKPERIKPVKKEVVDTKVDSNGFNQKLYMPALDKFTIGVNGVGEKEATENRKNVLAFHKNWVENQDGIRSITFETNARQSEITSVGMKLQNGEALVIPAWLFRQAFLVNRYQGKGGVGLEFVGGSKVGSRHITPQTTEEELENVMSKVNIDGVRLKRNVRVFVGSRVSEPASV